MPPHFFSFCHQIAALLAERGAPALVAILSLVLSLLSPTIRAWAQGDPGDFVVPRTLTGPYYDEIYNESGQVRPIYQEVFDTYQQMSSLQKKAFVEQSKVAFHQSNALAPIPRVIDAKEYDDTVRKGVEQRARALLAFLQDHYSGERLYAKQGLVPEDVVKRVLERNFEHVFEGQIRPEAISFIYGPDLIKDENGRWRVLEDNIGYVGGLGDLRLAFRYYNEHTDTKTQNLFRDPKTFYESFFSNMKKQALEAGGRAVLYMVPPYPDSEDARVRDLAKSHGVVVVTPRSRMQFRISDEGVFVYDRKAPDGGAEKVGYLYLNSEPAHADASHPLAEEKLLVEISEGFLDSLHIPDTLNNPRKYAEFVAAMRERPTHVEKIRKILGPKLIDELLAPFRQNSAVARGLLTAILDGKVTSNYTPGVDFVGDKEFYTYVEKLIGFYLREKPILRNIEMKMFARPEGQLDRTFFDKVFKSIASFVIKRVDGRSGDGVLVGRKAQAHEIQRFKSDVLAQPSLYGAQVYRSPSMLEEMIVDLRVFADVSAKAGVQSSAVPFGRGLSVTGNGKVNLGDSGIEILTLIRNGKGAGICQHIFSK